MARSWDKGLSAGEHKLLTKLLNKRWRKTKNKEEETRCKTLLNLLGVAPNRTTEKRENSSPAPYTDTDGDRVLLTKEDKARLCSYVFSDVGQLRARERMEDAGPAQALLAKIGPAGERLCSELWRIPADEDEDDDQASSTIPGRDA
jgi:hypothetical protein